MEKSRALELAEVLGVEVRDDMFHVYDICSVDGSPWVNEDEFMELVKEILREFYVERP